ncbi:MAG: hypothetical protein ACODAA_01855 [Gemmatimonadota bacterium]
MIVLIASVDKYYRSAYREVPPPTQAARSNPAREAGQVKKHQIEVDEEVFEVLQELATPLVDTPNSVLRRLLLEGGPGMRGRSTMDAVESRRLAYRPASLSQVNEERIRPMEASPPHAWAPTNAEEPGPYSSLGDERRAAGGMSPRRFGKLLCAREFPGEMFERARRDRGAFRTMFESGERLLYFLNFNKPGATNLWYKVPATALHALIAAEKPAYVVFTNPAERLAWLIPIEDLVRAYKERGAQALGEGDLDVNVDVEGNRVRELDWNVGAYRREL